MGNLLVTQSIAHSFFMKNYRAAATRVLFFAQKAATLQGAIFSLLSKTITMEKKKRPRRIVRLRTHNAPENNRDNQTSNFPGYPHHPANEDILNDRNGFEQADIDLEKFSRNPQANIHATGATLIHSSDALDPDEDELLAETAEEPESDVIDPEAEVTEEDLVLLGDPDEDMDGGEDELMEDYTGLDDTDFDGDPLNERTGHSGLDLDLPDDELHNGGSGLDVEDEENDFFSLGGDKDSLEDDEAGRDI